MWGLIVSIVVSICFFALLIKWFHLLGALDIKKHDYGVVGVILGAFVLSGGLFYLLCVAFEPDFLNYLQQEQEMVLLEQRAYKVLQEEEKRKIQEIMNKIK